MAELTGWPTDGDDGSVATEARWRAMARLWTPSGVVSGYLGGMVPTLGSGVVDVAAGAAWVDGHYCESLTAQSVPSTANGLLVIRFTPAENLFELIFRDGATTPTQTDAVWELPVARLVAGVMTDLRQIIPVGGSGLRRLGQVTLTADAPRMDFMDIPQDLLDLRVVGLFRSASGAQSQNGRIRFNVDGAGGAALYDNQRLRASATTASALFDPGLSGAIITMPGPTSLASYFAPITVDVPGYRHPSARRCCIIANGWARSTTGAIASGELSVDQGTAYWRAPNPVTQITISPDSGNMAAGSTATLYGT